jgi:hypothetical protein
MGSAAYDDYYSGSGLGHCAVDVEEIGRVPSKKIDGPLYCTFSH